MRDKDHGLRITDHCPMPRRVVKSNEGSPPSMGKYDTGSKKVVNVYNQAWAEWVLQQQNIEVETELSGEFQFIARSEETIVAAYHNEFMDQLTHIDFQVIKLWELEAEQVVRLTIRFNIDIENFTEQLEKLTAASLQKLNEIALTVDAPAQFEEALINLVTEENLERS